MRGTPVGYFGSPWWQGLPGTILLGDESTYEDVVSQPVPSFEEVLAFVESLLKFRSFPGSAGESHESIERKLGELPLGFSEMEGRGIAATIIGLIEEQLGRSSKPSQIAK